MLADYFGLFPINILKGYKFQTTLDLKLFRLVLPNILRDIVFYISL